MKVALCISGQPRGLHKAWEYIDRNILQPLAPDVFIHSWYEAMPAEVDYQVCNLYNSPHFEMDSYFHKNFFKKYDKIASAPHPAFNTGHMLYSVWAANELKRKQELISGSRYDIVIRCRFDYAVNRTLPLDEVEQGKVYVPNCRIHPQKIMCNDQFAWGTTEVMDMYSATFPMSDYLYRSGFIYNGEDLLSGNLQVHNLTGENMVYVDMANPFPPGPYNGTTHSLVRDDFKDWNTLRG